MGTWDADDGHLLKVLRQIDERREPTGYEPWRDWSVATEVVATLGGSIIEMDEPPEPVEDRVYGRFVSDGTGITVEHDPLGLRARLKAEQDKLHNLIERRRRAKATKATKAAKNPRVGERP